MQWPAFVHTGQLFVKKSTFHTDNISTWMREEGFAIPWLLVYMGMKVKFCQITLDLRHLFLTNAFILVNNNTHLLRILTTPYTFTTDILGSPQFITTRHTILKKLNFKMFPKLSSQGSYLF